MGLGEWAPPLYPRCATHLQLSLRQRVAAKVLLQARQSVAIQGHCTHPAQAGVAQGLESLVFRNPSTARNFWDSCSANGVVCCALACGSVAVWQWAKLLSVWAAWLLSDVA